jgi:methionyl-tRNA formyltransferase
VRLVFFGTGEFAVPALKAVADKVVLVVTQPDRPSGRGMSLKPSAVKLAAQELGLPIATPERARNPDFVEEIRELKPDALIVASYGQILSQSLLDTAREGGINLHGSILPKFRGAAPIQRAIQSGESESGVTLMQMDKGMDTGDIIDIARCSIGPEETYGELQEKLGLIAANLITNWIGRIDKDDYPRQPQNHGEASIAPKVSKEEAELKFEGNALDEFNRYRAFAPSPGPFVRIRSENLRLHKLELSAERGSPGTVLALKPFPLIAFNEGSLALVEVQPEGKKRMSGRDWANGARLQVGQNLKHG